MSKKSFGAIEFCDSNESGEKKRKGTLNPLAASTALDEKKGNATMLVVIFHIALTKID